MTNTYTLIEWAAQFVGIQKEVAEDGEEWRYYVGKLGKKIWVYLWNPLKDIDQMAMVLEKFNSLKDDLGRNMDLESDVFDRPTSIEWAFQNPEALLKVIKEVVDNE